MKTYLPSKFIVERDLDRCIQCKVCVNQCTFDTHFYDTEDDLVKSHEGNCIGCHRCVLFCPTGTITIRKNPLDYRENYNWRPEVIEDIKKSGKREMTIAEFKELTGLTRKYAIPLLELLDQIGVTRRKGSLREIL